MLPLLDAKINSLFNIKPFIFPLSIIIMLSIRYFGKDHRLRVIKPFYADFGKVLIPEGTGGKVIEGQDLYGYVFVEFYVGRRTIRERSVVTDYSLYVEDLDFSE